MVCSWYNVEFLCALKHRKVMAAARFSVHGIDRDSQAGDSPCLCAVALFALLLYDARGTGIAVKNASAPAIRGHGKHTLGDRGSNIQT